MAWDAEQKQLERPATREKSAAERPSPRSCPRAGRQRRRSTTTCSSAPPLRRPLPLLPRQPAPRSLSAAKRSAYSHGTSPSHAARSLTRIPPTRHAHLLSPLPAFFLPGQGPLLSPISSPSLEATLGFLPFPFFTPSPLPSSSNVGQAHAYRARQPGSLQAEKVRHRRFRSRDWPCLVHLSPAVPVKREADCILAWSRLGVARSARSESAPLSTTVHANGRLHACTARVSLASVLTRTVPPVLLPPPLQVMPCRQDGQAVY